MSILSWNRILLLTLFGIAVYWGWQTNARLYRDRGRLAVSQENNAVVLFWSSDIALPLAQRLNEAYEKWRDKTGVFIIDLNSRGGYLSEGRRVINVIARMKQTHQVHTRVRAGRICLSMCVPIFLQGQKRMAAANSKWMFHEPRSTDFFTDKDSKEPEFERRAMVERFFERYFQNSPMRPQWRDNLKKTWKDKDIWRSGQQLVDEESGIITQLTQ